MEGPLQQVWENLFFSSLYYLLLVSYGSDRSCEHKLYRLSRRFNLILVNKKDDKGEGVKNRRFLDDIVYGRPLTTML